MRALESITRDLDAVAADTGNGTVRKLLKTVEEFQTYSENNAGFIPNYGERDPDGETSSTAFVESTVNQVVSKRLVTQQQRRWSPRGAPLLLHVRTRGRNGDWRTTFRCWYPTFDADPRGEEPRQAA